MRGAGSALDKVVGVQTELSIKQHYEDAPAWTDVVAEVTRLGFALSGLFPVTLDDGFRLVEVDGVMVRSAK